MNRLCLPNVLFTLFIWFVLAGSGCAPKNNAVILAVGGAPAELDFWESIVHAFSMRTGYPVELLRQPTDTDQRRQNLITALRASQPTPDIFLMDVAWVAQFEASGWLEPLILPEASGLSVNDFFQPIIATSSTYAGTLLTLPVYIDGGLLYYRKDLLRKYGFTEPPRTWDELVTMSHAVIDKETAAGNDLTGFVWQGAQYEGLVCTFLEFAASNGGGINLTGSQPIIATQPNRKALDFMFRLIHTEKVSPVNTVTDMKEEEVRQAFQSGKALFERNWPYAYRLHQEETSPVRGNVGIAVLPHFSGGRSAATLGGWEIGISRFSRKKEQAFALMAYLLSFDIQKKATLELGWNPGRVDVYHDSDVVRTLPHLPLLHEVFTHAVCRPNVPWYSYLSAVLQRYCNAALAGTLPVDEAIDECEKELQVIVKQYAREQ